MIVYQVINCLISQPKHMLRVLKRNRPSETVILSTKLQVKSDWLENIYYFTLKNRDYLDSDVYSM